MTTLTPTRDLRIDFVRGLVLVFIFWDHIPGNWLGQVTPRNIGFSDAAEIFVFFAGYAAAMAYQKRYVLKGYFATALHILRRTWILYIAHVFLLAQLMAVIFVVNDFVPTRDFIEESGLTYFVSNPVKALVDGLLLRFKPVLMDPLPLYIVLLAALAAALPAIIRYPRWTLSLSAAIYVAAFTKQWNLAAQPGGHWFFNPFAWQFLFFLGALCSVHFATLMKMFHSWNELWRKLLITVVFIFLSLSAVIALSWHWPAWHDQWMPAWLAQCLYPIDKTGLAPIRLLHFMTVAFCIFALLPQGGWLDTPPVRIVRLLGRHSLIVFCFGVFLAPIADGINALSNDSIVMQTITSIVGVALMALIALLPEWFAQQQQKTLLDNSSAPLFHVEAIAEHSVTTRS